MSEAMTVAAIGPHRVCGRIGGRFYLNLSVALGAASALGLGGLARQGSEAAFGHIPADLEIPPLPMPRLRLLATAVPAVAASLRRVRPYRRRFDAYLTEMPARCDNVRAAIDAAQSSADLARLWSGPVEGLFRDSSRLLAAARLNAAELVRLPMRLRRLVGEGDTTALLTGLHTRSTTLASLGPLVGLDRLARGEIDRAQFAREWGHRCPDELEISLPRPAEDPAWIDRELAALSDAPATVTDLLARQ